VLVGGGGNIKTTFCLPERHNATQRSPKTRQRQRRAAGNIWTRTDER